jgi:hypothetical protein
MLIYGPSDDDGRVNEHCELGNVEYIWNDDNPTCDVALINLGANMFPPNSIHNAQQQEIYLERDPKDVEKDDKVHRFCNDDGTAKARAVGRVTYLRYYRADPPVINDCIAVACDDDSSLRFAEERDSGMLLTSVPRLNGKRMSAAGVAIIIAVQPLPTVDGQNRCMAIAQPFGRTLEKIRSVAQYRNIEIVVADHHNFVSISSYLSSISF